MKKALLILTVGALASGLYAEFKRNPDPNTLWVEEGGNTVYGKDNKNWRVLKTEITPFTDAKYMSFGGAKDLGRYVPVSPDYPYFIVKVKSNELKPKGYNAFSASFPGGHQMFGVVTKVPVGTYVVKHTMTAKRDLFLRIDYYGQKIVIEKMAMVKVPEVAVDMTPAVLKKGGELVVTVKLQQEADAVDVKFHKAYTMPQIQLNGKKSYEMTSDDSGKVWTLKVKYDNFTGFKPGEKLKLSNVIFAIEVIRGDKTEYIYAPSTFVTE